MGIGTISPIFKLDIAGNVHATSGFHADWGNVGAPSFSIGGQSGIFQPDTQTMGFVTSGAERMRLTFDGNVGIGTTNPTSPLHVVGDIRSDTAIITSTGSFTTDGSSNLSIRYNSASGKVLKFQSSNGSSEFVRIDSSGNVGIGTTTPIFKLDVNGSFAATSAQVAWGNATFPSFSIGGQSGLFQPTNHALAVSTSGLERMRVDPSGNVGIGTNAPYEKLTVFPSSGPANFLLRSEDDAVGTYIERYGNNANGPTNYIRKGRGTNSSRTMVSANDLVGSWTFQAYGSGWHDAAAIEVKVDGTPGATDMPGRMSFYTTPDGSSVPEERMRITSSGNVGIGTTSPGGLLAVAQTMTATDSNEYSQVTADLTASPAGTSSSTYLAANYKITKSTANSVDGLTGMRSTVSNASLGNINQIRAFDGVVLLANSSSLTTGYGIFNSVRNASSSGTISYAVSNHGRVQNESTGTVGVAIGVEGLIVNSGTGNVNTAKAISASAGTNNGTITNSYGLWIDNMVGTNQYGIWQNGSDDKNYFAGNVGIGTTSPNFSLDVAGTTHSTGNIYVGATGTAGQLFFARSSDGLMNMNISFLGGTESRYNNQAGGGHHTWYTNNGSTTAERMRMDSAGNVGIGTTTPSTDLAFGGTAARAIGVERNTIAGADGSDLTISAGSATSGSTDKNGGNLIFSSGTSTGDGGGAISFKIARNYQGAGTTDRTPDTFLHIERNGQVGVGRGALYPTSQLYVGSMGDDLLRLSTSNSGVGSSANINFEALNAGGSKTDFALAGGGIENGTAGAEQGFFKINTKRSGTMTEAMRVTAAGNVGIGTATPTAKLQVNTPTTAISNAQVIVATGSASNKALVLQASPSQATNIFEVQDSDGSVTSRIYNDGTWEFRSGQLLMAWDPNVSAGVFSSYYDTYITSGWNGATTKNIILKPSGSGNVGIGTTAPGYLLDVAGSARAGTAMYIGSTGNAGNLALARASDGVYNLNLQFLSGTEARFTNSSGSGSYTWYTNNGSTTAERMRMDASGNVGIGTTTPGYPLHIEATQNAGVALVVRNSSAGANANSNILATSDTASGGIFAYSSTNAGAATNFERANTISLMTSAASAGGISIAARATGAPITFHTGGSAEKMRITDAGNVGIGTTTPGYPLDITGQVRATNSFIAPNFYTPGACGALNSSSVGNNCSSGFSIRANNADVINILTNGNIGIGTSVPSKSFQVGAAATNYLQVDSSGSKILSTGYNSLDRFVVSTNAQTDFGASFASTNSIPGIKIGQGGAGTTQYIIGDTNGLLLNPTGNNVGIGTTTPSFILDVSGNATQDAVIRTKNTNAGRGAYFQAEATTSEYVGINLYGATQAWSLREDGSTSLILKDLTNSRAILTVEPNASANTLYLRSTGNVGIGTTSPGTALDVAGTARATMTEVRQTNEQEVRFNGGYGNQWRMISKINGATNAVFELQNTTDNFSSVFNTAMTWAPSGSVGIGTTVPGAKLEINPHVTPDIAAQLLVNTGAAAQKGLVIQGAAAQTADLQQWQASDGSVLAGFNQYGQLYTMGGGGTSLIFASWDSNANSSALWAGSGSNYQHYEQTIPSVEGRVNFNDIQGPTAIVRGGFQGQTWGLDASYKDTPGQMKSSSDVTVSNGSFNWHTFSLEGLYKIQNPWNLRFGLQHHIMPFMVLDADNSNVDVTNNTLTLATLGFDRSFPLTKKWRAEWMMRYQHPLLSGGGGGANFSVSPRFAFDGSIGTVFDLGSQLRLGMFWYGQWHEYRFTYGSDSISSFSGSQTLFYSNMEMRLGFEF